MATAKGEQVFTDELLAEKIIGHTELNSKNVSAPKQMNHAPRKGTATIRILSALLAIAVLLLVLARMLKTHPAQH
jgi:hypothetical protein